jgi:hypothetical protein
MIDSGSVTPGSGVGGGAGRGLAEPIPTLDPRGLALLVIGMALIGGWLARRRLQRGRRD